LVRLGDIAGSEFSFSLRLHGYERVIELPLRNQYALLPLAFPLADLLRLRWDFARDKTLAAERLLDGSEHLLTVEHADRLNEMTPPLQIERPKRCGTALSGSPEFQVCYVS
jgi:hypothetical protein